MKTDLIARLEALEKEATPGPWVSRWYVEGATQEEWGPAFPLVARIEYANSNCVAKRHIPWSQADADLLSELRNDLPAILHALKVQEAAEAYVSENPPLFLQLDSEMYYECCHCQSTARSENDVRHRDECPWVALVAAVKGEQK